MRTTSHSPDGGTAPPRSRRRKEADARANSGVRLLTSAATALVSASALAQAPALTNAPALLPPVIVTATASAVTAHELPFAVQTLPRERLREPQFRTVPETLRDVPSVMVQKTGHGQGSPFIRGFTGFRNVFLIDGIRLNNSVFRDGPNQYWNTVDPLSLDHLEVVKGPASVLYGSDAIGGTVNALTLAPAVTGEGFQQGGRVLYRVSSAENSHIARGEYQAAHGKDFGLLVGGSWKDFGDLRGGPEVATQRATGYPERDADAKLVWRLSDHARVTLAHQTVLQDDVWRTHRTTSGVPWHGTTIGTDRELSYDQHRHLTYAQYHADKLPSFIEEARFSVSHQRQTEDEFRVRASGARGEQGFAVDTLGVSAQFHSPSPVGRWTFGAEYYRDWVNSFSRQFDAAGALTSVDIQGPVGDDAGYDLAGFYAQNVVSLHDRVELTFGGRFTYAAAQAERVRNPAPPNNLISLSDYWSAVSGSARLTWQVDERDHWRLFTGVSQGFRAPNLSDLTRYDIAASSTEQEIPSLNLKPEQFISYEAGVKFRGERGWAEAAYYFTDIRDLIVRTPTGVGSEVIKLNSGTGHVQGVELSGGLELGEGFSARSSLALMDGRLLTYSATTAAAVLAHEPLSRLMPVTWQFTLRWDSPARRWWAEGQTVLAGGQHRLSSGDARDTQRIPPGGTPGYVIGNLHAGWQATRQFALNAAIENLTDADYRIHGSGLNEPGRNFILSGTMTF